MTADTWVVRIRVTRTCWTSPVMTSHEAEEYREALRAQVVAAGDGVALVDFRALGGRHVSVRARDVVSVETSPWIEHREEQEPYRASGGTVINATVPLGPVADGVADGTEFLRHLHGSRQPVVR